MSKRVRKIRRPEKKYLLTILTLAAISMLAGSLFFINGIQLKSVSSDGQAAHECRLIAGINIGDDSGGSMTKNETSGSGKTVILTIPAIVNIGNHVDPRPVTPVIELKTCPKTDLHHSETYTTTAFISPRKASEFTLVGARPSGTS